MKQSWTPLWSMIVESSVWGLPDWLCKVWITLLALKEADHVVRKSAYQIGHHARKSEAEILQALEIFSRPDENRVEAQEYEGRRVERVEDGWLILNGAKYQEMMQALIRRQQQAQWQREQRMIRRAVRSGEGLNPQLLTPELERRYAKAMREAGREGPEQGLKDLERREQGHIPDGEPDF